MRLEVYVAVEDIERAVTFYWALFNEPPATRTERYAAFDVGFGLMASTAYAVPVRRGNSAVPTLMVEDLEDWHERATALAPNVTDITQGDGVRFFMFLDPDGNVVEVATSNSPTR